MKQKVDVVLIPSFWTSGKGDVPVTENSFAVQHVNALCVSRAYESGAVIVYVNAAGYSTMDRDTLIGRTQITMPFQSVVERLNHNNPGVIVQELDLDVVQKAEAYFCARADRK